MPQEQGRYANKHIDRAMALGYDMGTVGLTGLFEEVNQWTSTLSAS
ncbi:MAG TPA: hypothetical protein VGA05_08435 [Candidatus Bathyarchaeia archaeon]